MAMSAPSPTPELGGVRRRPVPGHHEWHMAAGNEDAQDHDDQEEVVFEDEQISKFQEYFGIFCDYLFWILLAYCACNFLLWVGERTGLISPQFEEWNPARWWHSDPSGLQRELFQSAQESAATALQFEGLKRWIEQSPGGWVNTKLAVVDYLSERGRYERRLEVMEAVEEDEALVRLPLTHVLSSDFCKQDLTDNAIKSVLDAQKTSSEKVEIAQWTWITLYIIAHSRRVDATARGANWQSLLKSEYIDAALSFIPLFWDDAHLQWLNGTDLLNIHVLDVHAAIETEYNKLTYLVPSIEKSIPIIDFKKNAMVVMSRGETIDLPDREHATNMVPQLAIMPLIDLVDHHLPMPEQPLSTDDNLQKYQERGSHTNITYNADLAAVVLRAREPIPAKGAVTVGYGVRSNADYLLYHGFTMPREWSDLTLCTQYAMIELPLPSSLPSWKSRFLVHPYRFAVPACPGRRSTPHVVVGAARFITASEMDVVDFATRLEQDPRLLDGEPVSKDEKFLQHSAREALLVACDTKAQPPLCRVPLSLENERAAWELITRQTYARAAQHSTSIEEDEHLLSDDDASGSLTVNQRHAVIARREEKLVLRRWCTLASRIAGLLSSPQGSEELDVVHIPENETLENEEPRTRPRYWARLLDRFDTSTATPLECTKLR